MEKVSNYSYSRTKCKNIFCVKTNKTIQLGDSFGHRFLALSQTVTKEDDIFASLYLQSFYISSLFSVFVPALLLWTDRMGDSPQTAGNEPCEGLLPGEGREGGGGRCPSSPAGSGGEPGGTHGEGCSSSPPVSCPCLSWSRLTDAINDWILPVLSQGLKKGRRNLMLFPHLCKATASAVCGQHNMNERVCVWLWRLCLLHAEGRIVQSYVEKYFTFLLA